MKRVLLLTVLVGLVWPAGAGGDVVHLTAKRHVQTWVSARAYGYAAVKVRVASGHRRARIGGDRHPCAYWFRLGGLRAVAHICGDDRIRVRYHTRGQRTIPFRITYSAHPYFVPASAPLGAMELKLR